MGTRRADARAPSRLQASLEPALAPAAPADFDDASSLYEHLVRQPAAVVLAGHHEAVRSRVPNRDLRGRLISDRVLSEIVRALAHRPDHAPGSLRRRSLDWLDAVQRAV